MLAQGLAPAATTFQAVLTALLQRGSLEEADSLLATLAEHLQSSGDSGAPGAEVCPPAMQLQMHHAMLDAVHVCASSSVLRFKPEPWESADVLDSASC